MVIAFFVFILEREERIEEKKREKKSTRSMFFLYRCEWKRKEIFQEIMIIMAK